MLTKGSKSGTIQLGGALILDTLSPMSEEASQLTEIFLFWKQGRLAQ